MRSFPKATVLLLVLALVATACGARLTDEQLEFALQSGVGSTGQGGAGTGTGSPSTGDDSELALDPEVDGDGVAGPTVDDAGGDGGDGDDGDAAAGGGSGGAESADAGGGGNGGDGDGGGGGGGTPTDTRSMPEGGNGGATDVGVSEDEIVLANISDVSGAVPGLFEPEQLASQAFIEYFTAAEGTIYGRELTYLPFDGQMSAGANRSASIEACDRAFSAVGSMSAFDSGGAPVIDECGIPDIRTAATEPPMQVVDNAFPISITPPDEQPLGEYEYYTEQFPSVTENAAYLYIAGEVTAKSTAKVRNATAEHLGWDWTYVQEIDIAETNYAPFAIEMRDRGVEYVTFQGAYQQAVRLAEAMRQQNFEPEVYHLQSNTYIPDMIELGGEAIEGTYIGITSVMVEEAESNEELQRYTQFLNQVAPGERPTSLGMLSWSAAKLFTEIAKEVGPELTRARVLEELAQVEDWDGGGLHPPWDIGAQRADSCFILVQVQGGEFVREHPSSGFDCSGQVVPAG